MNDFPAPGPPTVKVKTGFMWEKITAVFLFCPQKLSIFFIFFRLAFNCAERHPARVGHPFGCRALARRNKRVCGHPRAIVNLQRDGAHLGARYRVEKEKRVFAKVFLAMVEKKTTVHLPSTKRQRLNSKGACPKGKKSLSRGGPLVTIFFIRSFLKIFLSRRDGNLRKAVCVPSGGWHERCC